MGQLFSLGEVSMRAFDISKVVQFDRNGRAYCPSCTLIKGRQPSQKSLALVPGTEGAYICHAGCTPEEIREAVGHPKPKKERASQGKTTRTGAPGAAARAKSSETDPSPQKGNRSTRLVSSEEIQKRHERLCSLRGKVAAECVEWLRERGIPWAVVEDYKLGVIDTPNLKGIQIPIPAGLGAEDGYYLKTRCYPFDQQPKWSQKGIPARIFWGNRLSDPSETILCEGEWDAMWLGWLVRQDPDTRDRVAVASFTCGASVIPSAEVLAELAGQVWIFYDLDGPGYQGAAKLADALGARAIVCDVPAPEDAPEGWDVSDALRWGAQLDSFRQAIQQALGRERAVNQIAATDPAGVEEAGGERERSRAGRALDKLKRILSGRLRFNKLTKRVELDGSAVQVENLYVELIDQHDLAAGKDLVVDGVVWLAKQASYSPVVEYLDRVHQQHGDSYLPEFQRLAARFFGTQDPLHQVFVRKTLLGAVARAYRPGCKQDTALILQGAQGVGKSSFFRILAGDWFNDSLGSANDKDERLKLHSSWICEWAELEAIFRRKDLAETKAFLSCQTDNLRVPYGRTVESFDRPSILVGTTNKDEFLSDPTGNRRFWVIPVAGPIDKDGLAADRDKIWAAAVELFKQGDIWWLTDEEAERNAIQNQGYQNEDPWEERIRAYLGNTTETTTATILSDCLQIEISRQTRADQMRVAEVLKLLGFSKTKTNGTIKWRVKGLGIPGIPGVPTPYQASFLDRDTSGTPEVGIPEVGSSRLSSQGYLGGTPVVQVSLPETLAPQALGIPGTPGIPVSLEGEKQETKTRDPSACPNPLPGRWISYRLSGGGIGKAQVIPRPEDWRGSEEPGVFVEGGDGVPTLVPQTRIKKVIGSTREEDLNGKA